MSNDQVIVIKDETFDNFFTAAYKLFEQIDAKLDVATATITQEEADFGNTFMKYVKALNSELEKRSRGRERN